MFPEFSKILQKNRRASGEGIFGARPQPDAFLGTSLTQPTLRLWELLMSTDQTHGQRQSGSTDLVRGLTLLLQITAVESNSVKKLDKGLQ